MNPKITVLWKNENGIWIGRMSHDDAYLHGFKTREVRLFGGKAPATLKPDTAWVCQVAPLRRYEFLYTNAARCPLIEVRPLHPKQEKRNDLAAILTEAKALLADRPRFAQSSCVTKDGTKVYAEIRRSPGHLSLRWRIFVDDQLHEIIEERLSKGISAYHRPGTPFEVTDLDQARIDLGEPEFTHKNGIAYATWRDEAGNQLQATIADSVLLKSFQNELSNIELVIETVYGHFRLVDKPFAGLSIQARLAQGERVEAGKVIPAQFSEIAARLNADGKHRLIEVLKQNDLLLPLEGHEVARCLEILDQLEDAIKPLREQGERARRFNNTHLQNELVQKLEDTYNTAMQKLGESLEYANRPNGLFYGSINLESVDTYDIIRRIEHIKQNYLGLQEALSTCPLTQRSAEEDLSSDAAQ